MVVLFFFMEFAAIREAHWSASLAGAHELEAANAELRANVTLARRLQRRRDLELERAASEFQKREVQCRQMNEELRGLREHTSGLSVNLTRLQYQVAVGEEVLDTRKGEAAALAEEIRSLGENASAMTRNLSELRHEGALAQEELDLRYEQFVRAHAEMLALAEENRALRANLTALREAEAAAAAHPPSGTVLELERENKALRHDASVLKESRTAQRVQRNTAKEELDLRYRQFEDMRKDVKKLVGENDALGEEISALRGE